MKPVDDSLGFFEGIFRLSLLANTNNHLVLEYKSSFVYFYKARPYPFLERVALSLLTSIKYIQMTKYRFYDYMVHPSKPTDLHNKEYLSGYKLDYPC